MEKTETKTGRKYSEKEIKTMATLAKWAIQDPSTSVPALALCFGSAKSLEQQNRVQNGFIRDFSVGSRECWRELTGDNLSELGSHIMGVVVYSSVFSSLCASVGKPFDEGRFLDKCWVRLREFIGVKEEDTAKYGQYIEGEVEQARKRLAAIKGGCDE